MPLDSDIGTLHIRCGSDIEPLLRAAGFAADFLEVSDPLCQGPVPRGDDWLAHRARFLSAAYGGFQNRSFEDIAEGLHRADRDLRAAAARYPRIVLWFEHDSYDQLILARCLAQFTTTRPERLELVQVSEYPLPTRFVGLGQLPAEAFIGLWASRRPVERSQIAAGERVWKMLRSHDPSPLAAAARVGVRHLPFMAAALRRHCQEFPWTSDGLSLTERLVLRLLAERSRTVDEIFAALQQSHEPLPFLGDTMLRFVIESMRRAARPVFTAAADGDDPRWFRERLTITTIGRDVLAGGLDFMALHPPARHLGGVAISFSAPSWRWDERTGGLIRA
jgi:hypothetical protein